MANDNTQADGYYAEDAQGADELDLSFLDEDEDQTDGSKADDAPKK